MLNSKGVCVPCGASCERGDKAAVYPSALLHPAFMIIPLSLQKEQWVAADMEESGSPMFTEPLTIDELTSAKQDFERAFQSNAQAEPAYASTT